MKFELNFNGLVVEIENGEIISKNENIPVKGIKALEYFSELVKDDYYDVFIEHYKIFSDVYWIGDDDSDSMVIFRIVCSYVANLLNLSTYLEDGYVFKTEITPEQIQEIENKIQ